MFGEVAKTNFTVYIFFITLFAGAILGFLAGIDWSWFKKSYDGQNQINREIQTNREIATLKEENRFMGLTVVKLQEDISSLQDQLREKDELYHTLERCLDEKRGQYSGV